MSLTIHTHETQGVTVAEIAGKLTLGPPTGQLRDQIKALLGAGRKIVLDLGKVDYIDSSGLGTLVGLHTSAAAAGARLKLAQVTPRTQELLVLTKLLTVFEIHPSVAAAVASFGTAAGA